MVEKQSVLLIGRPLRQKNQDVGIEFVRQFGIEVGPDLANQTAYNRVIENHLHGKSILLIRDSLTRYQYLNLRYFLGTGQWSSPIPHNENEKEFASWNQFYTTTTQINQYKICDCHRGGTRCKI